MTTAAAAQYVKYTFFKVDPTWRRLPLETRAQDKLELAAVIDGSAPP